MNKLKTESTSTGRRVIVESVDTLTRATRTANTLCTATILETVELRQAFRVHGIRRVENDPKSNPTRLSFHLIICNDVEFEAVECAVLLHFKEKQLNIIQGIDGGDDDLHIFGAQRVRNKSERKMKNK